MEDLDYFKIYKGSPLYNAIINYIRNRNSACIQYLNKECADVDPLNMELYKAKAEEFYKNYPPLFNKEVCHEEI